MDASASQKNRKRAAIYARVSTLEQVDGTSLATQVERCRAYVKSQGWSLAGELVDEGVSGAKAARPALDRLLALLDDGKVDAIVVAKLDRLGRSMRHLAALLGELDDRGVRLVSVAEGFDSQTPSGRLQRNILGSFAEFEREQIRERTMSGVAATVRDGFWPGGPAPYGWRLVRDGKHTKVELDPTEAAVLRSAAEMIGTQGLTTGEAAQLLNAQGSRSRRGCRWDHQLLRQVLLGPLAGEWAYKLSGGSRRRPKGPPLSVIHGPEIVPSPLREALGRHLGATRRGTAPDAYPYMLTGRFRSLCGDQYIGGQHPQQGPGYKCRRRVLANRYKEQGCDCHRIPVDLVDTVVWGGLVDLLSDADRLTALAEQWLAQTTAPVGVETESLGAIDRRIARLEANLAHSVADYIRQGIPGEAVRKATAEVTAEIEQAKAYRDRLAAVAHHRANAGSRVAQLIEAARGTLDDANPGHRRRVAELFGLRAELLAWEDCPGCHGSGKATGRSPGARCLVCLGGKRLPVLRVTGDIDPSVLRPAPGAALFPLPFSVDLRTAL